jgi:hypothetical protein
MDFFAAIKHVDGIRIFSLLKALQKELRQELFADCSAFGEVPGYS